MDYEERIRRFENELTALINKYSLENVSNTPDYILAKYLVMSLVCVNHAIGVREAWYGRQDAGRCEGGYSVPQTSPPREEPFEVTYRCALPKGHDGPHAGR